MIKNINKKNQEQEIIKKKTHNNLLNELESADELKRVKLTQQQLLQEGNVHNIRSYL